MCVEKTNVKSRQFFSFFSLFFSSLRCYHLRHRYVWNNSRKWERKKKKKKSQEKERPKRTRIEGALDYRRYLLATPEAFGSLWVCFMCSMRASPPRKSLWQTGQLVAFGPPIRAACCWNTTRCCNSFFEGRKKRNTGSRHTRRTGREPTHRIPPQSREPEAQDRQRTEQNDWPVRVRIPIYCRHHELLFSFFFFFFFFAKREFTSSVWQRGTFRGEDLFGHRSWLTDRKLMVDGTSDDGWNETDGRMGLLIDMTRGCCREESKSVIFSLLFFFFFSFFRRFVECWKLAKGEWRR